MLQQTMIAALMALSNDCSLLLSPGDRAVARVAKEAHLDAAPFLQNLTIPPAPYLSTQSFKETFGKDMKHGLGLFSLESYTVYIETRPFLKKANSDGLAKMRSVYLHEYGHLIFFANMARYDSAWRVYFELASRNKDKSPLLTWLMGGEVGAPASLKLSRPYQELFADLFPVVIDRNPSALEQAIGLVHPWSRSAHRRFDRASLRCRFDQEKDHDIFAPVRAYLWQAHFKEYLDPAANGVLIAKIFDVLAREVLERYADSKLIFMSPQEMNLRLLRRLHAAL